MIVNVLVGPAQLLPPLVKVGVTIIVPDKGAVPVLVAVNEISPVPLAARPIAVLLLVHAYVVSPPLLRVAKETVPVPVLHNARLDGWITCPEGLTVIVNVF